MKQVATFTINYLQYLDKDAKIVADLPAFAQGAEKLVHLYQQMVLLRYYDNKAINLQRTGKLGTYPASIGQEATFIGMGSAMNKNDIFVPHYRDQGTMLQRGESIVNVLRFWGGDERGSDYAVAKEDFPISIPVGSQGLHAAGAAYAIKLRNENRAVLTSSGDGATSEGDFYEAMNFAGAQHLPLVFVINNNQWAISVPREAQTAAETLAQKAVAAGIEGIQVDGCDVIAVYDAVNTALEKARNGDGPTVIESVNYRLCDHTTADDMRRYSDEAEVKAAWEAEPLKRLRKYLTEQNAWSDEQEQQWLAECKEKADQAAAEFVALKPQPATAMFDYLYAELPDSLKKQRDEVEGN